VLLLCRLNQCHCSCLLRVNWSKNKQKQGSLSRSWHTPAREQVSGEQLKSKKFNLYRGGGNISPSSILLGDLLRLGNDFVDASNHVERLLREVIVLTVQNTLETLNTLL
jgi:hypothetical protein